ncbi:MAG TPA: glycosyltransferase [Candidatus Obscuribacterales bacterium]
MPKGWFSKQKKYFQNPNIDQPLEKIFMDLDAYTLECFEDEPHMDVNIDFTVVLPPLKYKGRKVKGLYCSQAVDVLTKRKPDLRKLFNSVAYSMWISYPWSVFADAYLVLYDNPVRDEWFRRMNPGRADKILLPFGDPDFTNEEFYCPKKHLPKDIDVIAVARLDPVKNLPLAAEAVKVYREKYNHPIRMLLVVGREFGINKKELSDVEREALREMEATLVRTSDYIQFIPKVDSFVLSDYYARSKVCILASLIEGQNRSIKEATAAGTPAVYFRAFNQYARGNDEVLPAESGRAAEFSAEAMADAIKDVYDNGDSMRPREGFLKRWGKDKFFNRCMDSIPYYPSHIPDYVAGKAMENQWLNEAIIDNYNVSLREFLYNPYVSIARRLGYNHVEKLIDEYASRFLN